MTLGAMWSSIGMMPSLSRIKSDPKVVSWLQEAWELGLLGPQSFEVQLEHSIVFARAASELLAALAIVDPICFDLGSGAGIPGFVLAYSLPRGSAVYLVESQVRRAEFLTRQKDAIDFDCQVVVLNERAEIVGRGREHRGIASLVVARGFAGPAITAECAAPLLDIGGALLVSDPPEGGLGRWDPAIMDELGFERFPLPEESVSLSAFLKVKATPDRYPRRVGIPAKRPLF